MAYAHQKQVGAELRSRIPRGPRGSAQNIFRQNVSVHLLMNLSFEASTMKALASVRVHEPGFVPVILPVRRKV
jgi:hypothetical protein